MNSFQYVCSGSCKAVVSQKKFDEGLIVCGNVKCEMKGKPFTKIIRKRKSNKK